MRLPDFGVGCQGGEYSDQFIRLKTAIEDLAPTQKSPLHDILRKFQFLRNVRQRVTAVPSKVENA